MGTSVPHRGIARCVSTAGCSAQHYRRVGATALFGLFGVAQLGHGEKAAALVARADRALYQAKLNGRNRVEVAVSAAVAAEEDVGSAG